MTHIKYLLNCKKFISLMILFSFFDNFGMKKTDSEDSQNKNNEYNNCFEDEYKNIREFKVLFIGDSGVGKTCIISKFMGIGFSQSLLPTVAVDFFVKNVTIGNHSIKVRIWDCSGDEKFRSIIQHYYEPVQAFNLIYSVSDRNSFNSLEDWLEEVKEKNPNAMFLLVGNKIDVTKNERKVTTEEGKKFANDHNMEFVEVSGETGDNIEDGIFTSLIKKFLEEEKGEKKISGNSSAMSSEKNTNSSFGDEYSGKNMKEKKTNSSFCDECCSCCPCFKKSEDFI